MLFMGWLKVDNAVYSLDFTRALPPALKNDGSMLALAQVIATELQENIELAQLAVIYARIDGLPEELLDILAFDLHVDWYDFELPISNKRLILKDSVKIHKRLGTKYAVERAIGGIYPDSTVEEWFEYGGDPYHFKLLIDSTYEYADPEKHKRVLARVASYKNLRSTLDGVEYVAHPQGACTCYAGVGAVCSSFDMTVEVYAYGMG